MLAIGSTSYAAGLFVLPLQHDLGLSRADANSSIPILFTGGALMSLLVGYLLDRFAVQRIITVGAIAFGVGLAVISATSSVWVMVLALFIPVAFGFMAIGPLTTTTLVSRWFYRRRGRALGLATVATSGGGIVVVPLLSWAIQTYGWRSALFTEALLIASVVIVLSTFLIRSGPADLSLVDHPENKGRSATDMPARVGAAKETSQQPRWRLHQILTTWNFWAVAVAIAAITGVNQAIVVTIVPYATELGFLPASVALLITAFSISAAIVKVGSGILAEYIDQRIIMLASALAMIASLALLLTFSNYSMLIIASCLAGTALGCILPSSAVLVAACFGSPSFGTVMGAVYVAIGISSIASVRFVGAVFDRTGNYREAFITFMVLSVFAAMGSLIVRPSRGVDFSPEITSRAS
jgi:MFS family permease